MNLFRIECLNDGGYGHYFTRVSCDFGGPSNARGREILLECVRCKLRTYVTSVIRSYPAADFIDYPSPWKP